MSEAFEKHKLTMSLLMTPDKANFYGNVHGGDLLKILDQVSYACASRYCGGYVVTLSVDKVLFRNPIPILCYKFLRSSYEANGNIGKSG